MNTRNSTVTPQNFIKTITAIHLALLAGQVLFAAVTFVTGKPPFFSITYTKSDPYVLVVPIMAIGSFIAQSALFKSLVQKAAGANTLQGKLTGYQAAHIVRCALLEGASLFGIVTFLITGNLFLLSISALLMLYFISIRPTRDKVQSDLNLNSQEMSELA